MGTRILTIDDEPGFTRIVKPVLELEKPYDVMELNDPTQAVRVAHEFSLDIILLDAVIRDFPFGFMFIGLGISAANEMRGPPITNSYRNPACQGGVRSIVQRIRGGNIII